MLAGLRAPFLTEPDPDLLSEGSIDPLGLFTIADRLAEEVVPSATARMSRIRFVTAIAAASVITQDLADIPPADGVSAPYLVFEWHVIEAFARDRRLPREASFGVPGITKARSVVARNGHLDALSYLKGPKVFGFHGVYKRLARGMGVVDEALLVGERGDQLVRTWEREQDLPGFADRKAGTRGGRLADRLTRATLQSLLAGKVQEPAGSHVWRQIVRIFRPDQAGPDERRLLWIWLTDPDTPRRREVVKGIEGLNDVDSEEEALRALHPAASSELAMRLDAIEAYERVAELLTASFSVIRFASTSEGWVRLHDVSRHPLMGSAASLLPEALERAAELLAPLGLEVALDRNLGGFTGIREPRDLLEHLLDHHRRVQAGKPPGKRPWFEETSSGLMVRPPYRLEDEPEIRGSYIHPYRIQTIGQFIKDLR